ncbi:hypothetical protein BDV93DRAFT_99715 [Ceratobasidium sp. AG-I]|nr:hypothetical protein BDV93DRAFT_99715 [Ceratobasidium sp. AG-I]
MTSMGVHHPQLRSKGKGGNAMFSFGSNHKLQTEIYEGLLFLCTSLTVLCFFVGRNYSSTPIQTGKHLGI